MVCAVRVVLLCDCVLLFSSFPFFPSLCSLLQHCWFSVVSLLQGCVIVE